MLPHTKIGSGHPVVFLHAFPLSRKMWTPNLPALSKSCLCVSVDLPGFGESFLNRDACSMEFMADEVIQTLDFLDIQGKVAVVGVSMGGYVAFQLIGKYPNRIDALGLVSTRATPDTPVARAKRMENIRFIREKGTAPFVENMINGVFAPATYKNNPDCVKSARQWMEECRPEAVISALFGMAERPDSTPLLDTIQVPALVVAGAQDKLSPAREMKEMAGKIPHSQFHEIPDAGHLLSLEHPQIFNRLLLDFLQQRRGQVAT